MWALCGSVALRVGCSGCRTTRVVVIEKDAAVVYRSKWETLQQLCRHLLLSEIDASHIVRNIVAK